MPAAHNLLFIYTDEQAFNTLAAYGNHRIAMPNLDRLAAQSMVFDQAYVTQPVCTPSRSSLLTGLYPHANGCQQNNRILKPEIPCLPEMTGETAFMTGHYGKWHLGDELFAQHGFREWVSIEDGYNGYFRPDRDREVTSSYHDFLIGRGVRPANGRRFNRGEAARFPEELGKPAFLGRAAADFIRRHRADPFMLYVNFLEPHMPYFGPRDGQYDPETIPLPSNFDDPLAGRSLKARLLRDHYRRHGHSGLPLVTETDWRRMIANYWGLCSLVDTHVGVILDALEDCGLADRTLVVFTSDHGDMMGAHRLLAKTVMFEEAIRVPLLIRLPGQRDGRRIRGPVSQIDLVPTLLDLLGQPVPDGLHGRSLRPLIEDPAATAVEPVIIEWNGPNNGAGADTLDQVDVPEWMTEMAPADAIRASMTDPVRTVIRADGWKYSYSPLGEHELCHLGEDPGETVNRFGDPGLETVVAELTDTLRAWQRRTGVGGKVTGRRSSNCTTPSEPG